MRNLKIGMVLAAVLAMSVIGAAAAQAGSLDVGIAGAKLEGTQGTTAATKDKLTVTSATGTETLTTVKCTTATIEGVTSTTSVTSLEVTPKYGAAGTCELGGLSATVSPGTCKYTLSGVGTAAKVANASVTGCTSTLSITQGTCTLSVTSTSPTSETLEKVSFASVAGAKSTVTATLEVKKIKVSGSTGCPANLQVAGNTGDLTGTQNVSAFENKAGGAQVSLEAT